MKVQELQILSKNVNEMRQEVGRSWGLPFKLWLKELQTKISPISADVAKLIMDTYEPFKIAKKAIDAKYVPEGKSFEVVGMRSFGLYEAEVYPQTDENLYNADIMKLQEEKKEDFKAIEELLSSEKEIEIKPIAYSLVPESISNQQLDAFLPYFDRNK